MRVPERTSIRGKIWVPFTPATDPDCTGHLFFKHQLCSRGENFSSYRVSRQSHPKPLRSLVPPPHDTLEHDLRPGEGEESKRHKLHCHAARIKLPNHVAEAWTAQG